MKDLLERLNNNMRELLNELEKQHIKCRCIKADLWPTEKLGLCITIWDGEKHLYSPKGDTYLSIDDLLSTIHTREILFREF